MGGHKTGIKSSLASISCSGSIFDLSITRLIGGPVYGSRGRSNV